MLIGRLLGWLLMLIGLAAVLGAAALWVGLPDARGDAAGQVWFLNARGSLNLTQAIVQRYLHPALWEEVIVPLLMQPAPQALVIAALPFLLVGLLLAWLFRRRARAS